MQQPRKQVRELRIAARDGDAEAMKLLLAHNVALRHDRLSVRRFLFARALGATGLDPFLQFSLGASRRIETDTIIRIAREAAKFASEHKGLSRMRASDLSGLTPFILPFDCIAPMFGGELRFCGEGASVLGKVMIGLRATLGPGSVIRADGHHVRIGDDFLIGENSTVHIAHDIYPAIIGDRVSVGRNAVVHACTVRSDCVIEDDVVVLDGSVVEDRVLIEAGSTIYPRSSLKSGFVYGGSPAAQIRELTSQEHSERSAKLQRGIATSLFSTPAKALRLDGSTDKLAFVAGTAHLTGHVDLRARSSVFFSCVLNAQRGAIIVGDNSNIQDNTRIHCSRDGVSIGCDTTIGHNVSMQDCRIGDCALVGIGSAIAAATIIEDDVLLAAGSSTQEGQRLGSGWLWAGRPARPVSELDDSKRTMMRAIVEQYCAYSEDYREATTQIAR